MSCCGETIQDVLNEIAPNMGKPRNTTYRWQSVSQPIEAVIAAAIGRWAMTPYVPGQRAEGLGTDCVQVIPGVYDILFKNSVPTPVPRLPGDSGAHTVRVGLQIIRALKQPYSLVKVRDNTVEPGDIIVVRNTPGQATRPGHTLIAGTRPHTAWHAVFGAGFIETSLAAIGEILAVARSTRKAEWSV